MTTQYQPDLSPPGKVNTAGEQTFKVTLAFGAAFLESYKGRHIVAQRTAPGTMKLTLPRTYRMRSGFKWGWGKRGAGAVLFPVITDDDSATTGVVLIETRTEAGVATDPADGDELDLEMSFSLDSLNDDSDLTPPAPTVTSLDVITGLEAGGAAVTITGENFSEGADVFFGADLAGAIVYVDENTITCTSPAHDGGAVAVKVVNPDGQEGSKAAAFTYAFAPEITSITPDTGAAAGGESVGIAGLHFVALAAVTFDGTPATGVVVTPTLITCDTPAHGAGAVDVVVTNPDTQADTLVGGYTYA